MKQTQQLQKHLRCPKCKGKLNVNINNLVCLNEECRKEFPFLDKIPVLINEENSIFSIKEISSSKVQDKQSPNRKEIKSLFTKFIPSIGNNIQGKKNYLDFLNLLLEKESLPRVLVLGGSSVGIGMESIVDSNSLELIETDVSLGPRTDLLCDAHDIPFEDGYFKGVIIQAVLEHVVDPNRCVEEIHRVLDKGGLVYSETPFMQQVHMGRYDFTRFTHLGHRRLFRRFEEIRSGVVCGPGMAFAWSYQYFLLSFTKSKPIRKLIIVFTNFTSFFLKYFDYYLIKKSGSYDSASGFFFIGKKSKDSLSDKELIKLYRGAL